MHFLHRDCETEKATFLLKLRPFLNKQVTRGQNIVADGWAGASNFNPHPNPPPTLEHTQKVSKTLVFNSITMRE